ncbi:hypothetical protein FP2506_14124 [Fulvimarina pelagi HTCC2506]|uniref:Uncharacterized protein n=1 Tax=Fulvimarina pelagi HTCC2506 TaxID=314231 RepID=Q0G4A5_9HYPH|nr:hypothetical protein FP2506_14124 [Fulvimarina pelagi HTCC2506]
MQSRVLRLVAASFIGNVFADTVLFVFEEKISEIADDAHAPDSFIALRESLECL